MRYTIKPGDTLSKIAETHGITLDELLDANPRFRGNPDRILVGDQLQIPEGDQPPVGVEEAQPGEASQRLGQLSVKYETSGRGPSTVSGGGGDAGGVSYGSYQMTSEPNGGTVALFVSQPNFPWRQKFQNLRPASGEFTAKWKEIAKAHPQEFHETQHAYIKKTHFDQLVAKIKNEDGLDITTRSHTLQDVVWSTAVQHGPNTPVVHRALATVTDGGAVNLADPELDKKLIHAIYAERGRKDVHGTLVYFSRNSVDVQQSVANRFVEEEQDAINMLAHERQ